MSQQKPSQSIKRQGFTLIELLVVVAIIALLISILLPSLNRARNQAKRTVCGTQLRDIANSLASYENDFDRLPPQNGLGANLEDPLSVKQASAMWGYNVHREIAAYVGGMDRYNGDGALDYDDPPSLALPTFYCPFVPLDDIDEIGLVVKSSHLHSDGSMPSDDDYITVTYAYYGRLDEVINDPAAEGIQENGLTVLGNPAKQSLIESKRAKYADALPTSDDILMADQLALWVSRRSWRANHPNRWGAEMSNDPTDIDGMNQMFADGHVSWKDGKQLFELTDVNDRWQNWIGMATLRRLGGGTGTRGSSGEAYWW
jgi:prepilin-type N-terminal cleavage/methylation domain-containing protein/prepilin-type processing-associated H-X9-DG protein